MVKGWVASRPYTRSQSKSKAKSGAKVRVAKKTTTKKKRATKTKTGTKLKIEKIKLDGPVSESSIHVPLPGKPFTFSKTWRKMLGDQVFVTNSSTRVPHGSGRQNNATVASYWENTDLGFIMTQAGTISNQGSTVKNFRTYMKEMNAQLLITNQTNDVVHLKLYDCIQRRDAYSANYADPSLAWQQGISDQNGSGIVSLQIGNQPFSSSLFCEYFKVIAIKDIMLHSGGHHVHKVHSTPKKCFNNELQLINAGAGTQAVGFTHFTMAVQHGFGTNNNALGDVTTASGAVDYILAKQYTWGIVQNNNSQPIISTNLTTTPAQQDIINDLTGATTAVTTT